MSRTQVLLTRSHGAEAFDLFAGPETPMVELTTTFREFLTLGPSHPELAEVQLWSSDGGLQRTIKFRSPEDHDAYLAKREKDRESHAAWLASKKAETVLTGGVDAKPEAPASESPEAPSDEDPETDNTPANRAARRAAAKAAAKAKAK